MSINSVKNSTIDRDTIVSAQIPNPPKITSYSVDGLDDTALDPAGGQTVLVNGSNFQRGATVTLNGTAISVVSWVSSSQLSFTSPANSAGTYQIYVVNVDGGTAIYLPGIIYSTLPTWTTAQGTLGSYYETTSISETVEATGDAPVIYSLYSGSLPTGATLNSDGTITGTSPVDSGSTTYQFTIKADDAQLQSSTRLFSLTINTDVVTWVTPSSGATINLDNTAYSQSLSASDAAGYSVSYTANALPTGLTLSTGTISGTATTEGTTTTLLTATAATTGRSSENTITWVVSLNDTYWKYATLLLSADSSIQTKSFVADNSINNNQLTVAGDTRVQNFNPYQRGYYSTYMNGQVYAALPASGSNFYFTGDFTIEAWVYPSSFSSGDWGVLDVRAAGQTAVPWVFAIIASTYKMYLWDGSARTGATTITPGKWYHMVWQRTGAVLRGFLNGVLDYYNGSYGSGAFGPSNSAPYIGTKDYSLGGFGTYGHISNLRVVNGAAVYTTSDTTVGSISFTPPTSPLLVTTKTVLLACQSNSHIDNSPNNFSITPSSSATVTLSSAHPFLTVYQAGTQYYSTNFNGSSDYLTVATNTAFGFGTGDFTIEFWVYPTVNARQDWVDITNGTQRALVYYSGSAITFYSVPPNSAAITGPAMTLNTWQHIAVSKISGSTKMYVNGSQVGSTYTPNQDYGTSNPVTIGKDSAGSTYVTGRISNVRVVKGLGVYTGNFTVPTSPLTATQSAGTNISAITTGQTSLLTCQDSTFKDNSTNAFTITATTTVKPLAVSPFTPSSYTNTEITTYGSGYFDGTGDYLSASSPLVLSSEFTAECWFNNTSASGIQQTLFTFNSTSGNGYGSLRADCDQGNVQFNFTVNMGTSGSGWTSTLSTNSAYIKNTWNHFAVTRNSSNLVRVFLNGVQITSGNQSGTLYSTSTTHAIGCNNLPGTATNPFTGYISDLRLINGTCLYNSNFLPQFTSPLSNVTNTQLLTLQSNGSHNNSVFKDSSSFNNIVTRATSTNATNGTFSPYGDNFSNYFDGTGDYLQTASAIFGLGTVFTFEAWVYPTALVSGAIVFASTASGEFSIGYNGTTRFGVSARAVAWLIDSTTLPTLNTWNHIVVARGGLSTNQTSLYINGTRVANTTVNNAFTTLSTWQVGYDNGGGGGIWKGYISNLRVVAGTDIYGYTNSTITSPTSPLTAVANTQLLTCRSNRLIDNSINNYAITRAGDTSVQKFSPFSMVTVSNYYSTYFNGSSDYLTVGGTTAFNLNSAGSYTLEAWIYSTGGANSRRVVASKDHYSGTTYPSFSWYIESTNKMNFSIGSGTTSGTGSQTMVGTVTISLNTWYHVAFVVSGSTWYMFVNGEQEATGSITGTVGYSTNPIIVGSAANGIYFNGYISNIRITKSAVYTLPFTPSTIPLTTTSQSVSAANVSLLTCQNNTIIDNSTNYYAITSVSTVKVVPISPFTVPAASAATSYSPTTFGGSMYFDGTGDKLTVANYPSLAFKANDFTIQCWFYTNAASTEQVIMTNGWASYAPWLIRINTSNQVMLNMSTNGGSWHVNEAAFGTCTPGQWYHVAVSRSSGVLRAFLNGIQGYTTDLGTTALYDGSQALNIGGRSDTSVPMNGYISDAQLINGRGLYSANFYPGTTPAVPSGTIGTSTYSSTLLLSGTSGGVIDATRTVDLETVADAKVTNFGPYNGSYYSTNFTSTNSDAFTLSTNTAFDFSTGDFTVEGWFISNRTNDGSNPLNIAWYIGTINGSNAIGGGVSDTEIQCRANGSTNILSYVGTFNTKWNHVAWVRSSGTLTIYLNGVSVTSTAYNTSVSSTGGVLVCYNNTSYRFSGNISNFRIVKGTAIIPPAGGPTSPLTAVSGTSLLTCQSNKFVDNSTNAFALTVVGTPKVATQNPFQVNTGLSYYFDGTGDYCKIVNAGQTTVFQGDFTIECWVYYDATSFTNYAGIVGGDSGNFVPVYVLSTNKLECGIWGSSAIVTSTGTITTRQWVHIALVRSSGVVRWYINGTQDSATANNSSTLTIANPVIGTSPTVAWNGYISDLRITKYARTITVPTTPYKLN